MIRLEDLSALDGLVVELHRGAIEKKSQVLRFGEGVRGKHGLRIAKESYRRSENDSRTILLLFT